MNQVVLSIDLSYKLQENDVAFAVNDLVEAIPDEALSGFLRSTGCPAYHPKMMMKLILYAYTESLINHFLINKKVPAIEDR
ncbi:transposase [Alteribacter natronophilus]|nr:transposase [Alteribacter natronophilus]